MEQLRRRGLWLAGGIAVVAVLFAGVPAPYVLGPLLGLAMLRVGLATVGSLRAGGAHAPDGSPRPVDLAVERVTYWCDGCGTELLLLVRGSSAPPRHCGERMAPRHEVRRQPSHDS